MTQEYQGKCYKQISNIGRAVKNTGSSLAGGLYKKVKKGIKPYAGEIASTAVLAGAIAYGISGTDFLRSAKNAAYFARHVGNTGVEMVMGSKGERGVKNLEEALELVNVAAENNSEARSMLEKYVTERKGFAKELGDVYKENETVSREAERLKTQLQGFLVNFFQIGNDVKTEQWKKIDDAIVGLYGIDPVAAREKSANVRKFYDEVRTFYDSREKNETTIQKFCDSLAIIGADSQKQNESIKQLFPKVVEAVREGYAVEDSIFSTGEKGFLGIRKNVSTQETAGIKDSTGKYSVNVDRTERDIIKAVPEIKPYSSTNVVDILMHPLTIGALGALTIKGASSLMPGGRRLVTATTLLPFSAVGKTGRYLHKMARRRRRESLNKSEIDYQI